MIYESQLVLIGKLKDFTLYLLKYQYIMELKKMKENNEFALINVTFAELKAIKDACEISAKSGSKAAKNIYSFIENEMNNLTI